MTARRALLPALALAAAACGESARLPVEQGEGAHPALPAPVKTLVPTAKIAPARGWAAGERPFAPSGAKVTAFASGLQHPRWLHVLPNGDVLVAETNAPSKPDDHRGMRGWLMSRYMKKAGSAGPSANRITLLRDADHDGKAELRTVFTDGLNSPFGMALVGATLYVADTDAVLAFHYADGVTAVGRTGVKVVDLPAGPLNHHWTKNIIASPDGTKLYATIGSNSNAAEHGMDKEIERAAIWEIELPHGAHRVMATGLRNPVGLAWEPETGALWTAVNERDELGSDVPPDYLTAVRDGGFYGWPYSYFGAHLDPRVKPQRPELVARAIVPDYALGPHTASLGLAYTKNGPRGPAARSSQGMYVGQHGSWNRKPLSGYKVVFVPFVAGKPAGPPVDVLTGFLSPEGDAYGRPVGVAVDEAGALYVADDVGNTVWRVAAAPVSAARE